MPILRTLASGLLSRRAARRISRLIPNPVLRYVAVTAATALAPLVVDKVVNRWKAQRGGRATRSSSRALAAG